MTFRFKPEDFEDCRNNFMGALTVTEIIAKANRLLEEHVKTLPVVTSCGTQTEWSKNGITYGADTHRARLWCVEEIKPKKCEHDFEVSSQHIVNPPRDRASIHEMRIVCPKCNRRLQPKWEAE